MFLTMATNEKDSGVTRSIDLGNHPRELSTKVWNDHITIISQFLNPGQAFEYLVEQDLLTQDEQTEFTVSRDSYRKSKEIIMTAVPQSKHDNFLARFIAGLQPTTEDNRGHSELIQKLTKAIEDNRETFVNLPTERPQGFFKDCCTRQWLITYCATVAFLAVLALIVIITLSQTPSLDLSLIRPQSNVRHNTVSVDFGIPTKWIQSLSLSVTSCTGRVTVVDGHTCEQLPVITQFFLQNETGFPLDLYLLPGSYLNITAARNPERIYIVQSRETYEAFANMNGDGSNFFQCSEQQENVNCFSNFQEPILFNVTKPDYYAIDSDPSPLRFGYTLLSQSYDINKIRNRTNFQTREIIVSPSSPRMNIPVSTFLDLSEKCVLLTSDCSESDSSRITYQSTTYRRQDLLIYPALAFIVICILSLLLISFAHCTYYYYMKK